jgi:quercetin dioxygenase-like cupin family protein
MSGKFVLGENAERDDFDWGSFSWISKPATTAAGDLVVCHVSIEPSKGHNFHRHPNQEEVIHVIEGTMEQWLDSEKKVLGPGDSVFIGRDTVHASFNVGDDTLKVLAILGPSVGEEGYELIDVSTEEPWASMRS